MKLSNQTFDILKWITMIVIPALTTAYVGLASIWSWPFAEEVAKTSAVIGRSEFIVMDLKGDEEWEDRQQSRQR